MLDFDTVYDSMTAGILTGIRFCAKGESEQALYALRDTLRRAELLHSYLGFQAENADRAENGLASLTEEDSFSPEDREILRRYL